MTDSVVFWNVERLFHPAGSPLSRSVGVPDGWSKQAYVRKIDRVATVLNRICSAAPPAMLLLNEVENSAVVSDILQASGWSSLREVVVPGEQIEGYDVAMTYDPSKFEEYRPATSFNIHNRFSTRDLLVAHLRTRHGDEITVINNHWPSRTVADAAAFRLGTADYCSRIIEKHLKFDKADLVDRRGYPRLTSRDQLEERWNRAVIVVGDLNDNPFDVSVRHLGNSTPSRDRVTAAPRFPKASGRSGVASYMRMRPRLYNPTWALVAPNRPGPIGSYHHAGEWHWLDQALVSRGMIVGDGPQFVTNSLHLHLPQPTIENGKKIVLCGRGGIPRGFSVRGGVSDHLPVVFELRLPSRG